MLSKFNQQIEGYYARGKVLVIFMLGALFSVGPNVPGAGDGNPYLTAFYGEGPLVLVRMAACALLGVFTIFFVPVVVRAMLNKSAVSISNESVIVRTWKSQHILRSRVQTLKVAGDGSVHVKMMGKLNPVVIPANLYRDGRGMSEALVRWFLSVDELFT